MNAKDKFHKLPGETRESGVLEVNFYAGQTQYADPEYYTVDGSEGLTQLRKAIKLRLYEDKQEDEYPADGKEVYSKTYWCTFREWNSLLGQWGESDLWSCYRVKITKVEQPLFGLVRDAVATNKAITEELKEAAAFDYDFSLTTPDFPRLYTFIADSLVDCTLRRNKYFDIMKTVLDIFASGREYDDIFAETIALFKPSDPVEAEALNLPDYSYDTLMAEANEE